MLTRYSRDLWTLGEEKNYPMHSPALPYTRILTRPDQIEARFSGQDDSPPVLSKRELQVLLLICDGLTGKEIAQRLGISPKTVGFHKEGLYKRLGLNDTVHLVRYAIRMGLIEP